MLELGTRDNHYTIQTNLGRKFRIDVTNTKCDKNNMKKNNDNSTNNGNIILIFPLKLYPLESYGRELQHMLKSTLLDY
ncbi:hypothetical protein H8356DRAFT_1423173 [Neocallimastix lanati (nom. inval.)]|nr:hypothetical protein H8356DRAFT_1423173 [Neocallimastix sp. JGI-2020a]